MNAVFLFDTSATMAAPWAAAGVDCHCFDLQNDDSVDGRVHRWRWSAGDDIGGVLENALFVAAFPPCTDVAHSGARWFKGKGLHALADSIRYFAIAAELCEASGAPYMIENPRSMLSSYWREPDHKFHPAQYQGYTDEWCDYTKETWLWCGGGFVMPPMSMEPDLFSEPDRTYIHHQSPGDDRANIRSKTAPGFPEAVFLSNAPLDLARDFSLLSNPC